MNANKDKYFIQIFLNKKVLSVIVLSIAFSGLYWQLTRLGYIAPLPYLLEVICFNNCEEGNSIGDRARVADNQLLNYDRQIKQILGLSHIDKSKTSILIEKSKYRLTVYYDRQPLKSYPVVFGSNPVDDKLKEGDSRTPEGKLKIKDLYPHQAWSKFIWLDYPNKYSWRKHFQAKINGKINWNDSIGSEIGIHGTPRDGLIEERRNWTLGCISLKNKDVDELYQIVQKGTEVEIIK